MGERKDKEDIIIQILSIGIVLCFAFAAIVQLVGMFR